MEHTFDIDEIKLISRDNKYNNYVTAIGKLCAEKPRAVSVANEHSYSVNNALFEIDAENQRLYNFILDRRWDIVTDFRCEVLVQEHWTPLDAAKLTLFVNESETLAPVTPDTIILPMCTQFAALKIQLQLGFVVPLFFRVRYTGHLLGADERRLWISRDFECDGLRYASGITWKSIK
jgi:hypothetical protein